MVDISVVIKVDITTASQRVATLVVIVVGVENTVDTEGVTAAVVVIVALIKQLGIGSFDMGSFQGRGGSSRSRCCRISSFQSDS